MVVRVVGYVVLVPAFTALALSDYNIHRTRRSALWALTAVYFGIALASLVVQIVGYPWSPVFRIMLTPVIVMQTVLAVWIWLQPMMERK